MKYQIVDNAHAAGYTVVLHVLLIPEELAVQPRRIRGALADIRWRRTRFESATTACGVFSPTRSRDASKLRFTATAQSRVLHRRRDG
jgi:hypothetical protein